MHRTIQLLTTCCLLLACAACTNNAPRETTNTAAPAPAPAAVAASPAQIVRASADAVTLKAGATTEAQVRLQIADGYHVNANPATFSYLKPTELEVEPGGDVTPGRVMYPAPVKRQFKFAPQPLAVYESETALRVSLTAAGGAARGAQTLHARVNVQACDEEKCFPPTTIETDIPVTIN